MAPALPHRVTSNPWRGRGEPIHGSPLLPLRPHGMPGADVPFRAVQMALPTYPQKP